MIQEVLSIQFTSRRDTSDPRFIFLIIQQPKLESPLQTVSSETELIQNVP